jgi:hypothetical protein
VVDAVKPGGGKQKGASFEREICVALSKWLSKGLQEDVFWRSAMSGGRSTVAFKRGKRLASQVGDISCIHPIGNHFINTFAPECKFYNDLEWKGLLTGKGKIISFWIEINEQAGRYGKLPFLVARQNRMPAFVCVNNTGMIKLGLDHPMTSLISFPMDMYVIHFDRFVEACEPYVADSGRSSPNRQRTRLTSVPNI